MFLGDCSDFDLVSFTDIDELFGGVLSDLHSANGLEFRSGGFYFGFVCDSNVDDKALFLDILVFEFDAVLFVACDFEL